MHRGHARARRAAAADGHPQRHAGLVLRRRRDELEGGAARPRADRRRRRHPRHRRRGARGDRPAGPRTKRSRASCGLVARAVALGALCRSTPTSRRWPRRRSPRAPRWSTTCPGCATWRWPRSARGAGPSLVIMHTRVAPKGTLLDPGAYDDVVADVASFLRERMAAAVAAGLPEERIVLDPGPDFAKTPAQTVAVLRRLDAVRALGRPLLLAVSRKDFLGAITGRAPRGARSRDAGGGRLRGRRRRLDPARPRRRRHRRLPGRARGAAGRARARAVRRVDARALSGRGSATSLARLKVFAGR